MELTLEQPAKPAPEPIRLTAALHFRDKAPKPGTVYEVPKGVPFTIAEFKDAPVQFISTMNKDGSRTVCILGGEEAKDGA